MSTFFKKYSRAFFEWSQNHSTLAFFLLLGVLLGVIVLSHILRMPEPAKEKPVRENKQTEIYSADSPLYISAVTNTKKEGVVSIVALTPGVVTDILVRPGQRVTPGATLLHLTNDYQSGSLSLEKQKAANNLSLANEINQLDKDIRLREERVIKRSAELNQNQEEIALNDLKKRRTNQRVALANAELDYELSTLSDAVLHPKALNGGLVQSIKVRRGQYVNVGQVLATISRSEGETSVDALLESDAALYVDTTKEAKLTLTDGTTLRLLPQYFSAAEDEEGMYTFRFAIPTEYAQKISTGKTVRVELPLRFQTENTLLVPLDAVFQTSVSSTILVLEENKAKSKAVELGQVHGNFVEVKNGLERGDAIILNRFVIEGDVVDVIQ